MLVTCLVMFLLLYPKFCLVVHSASPRSYRYINIIINLKKHFIHTIIKGRQTTQELEDLYQVYVKGFFLFSCEITIEVGFIAKYNNVLQCRLFHHCPAFWNHSLISIDKRATCWNSLLILSHRGRSSFVKSGREFSDTLEKKMITN